MQNIVEFLQSGYCAFIFSENTNTKHCNLLSFFQAPSFVFVDEIDAIAGRHARLDPRRRATFEALIAQLDGE